MKGLIRAIAIGVLIGAPILLFRMDQAKNGNIREVRKRIGPGLSSRLEKSGFSLGNTVFLRVFKEESVLEVWLESSKDLPNRLWHSYPIAKFSGTIGPKLREGDRQAPEGFYSVNHKSLNPNSSFHLSFDVGYPNHYDQKRNRTGSHIMVHGGNVSIGCFAMTDPAIEEIYLIVEAALNKGQDSIPIHIFPFRFTEERMLKAEINKEIWLDFWKNLKVGYDLFEVNKSPPSHFSDRRGYVLGYES